MEHTAVRISGTDPEQNQAVDRLLEQEGIMRDKNLDYTCAVLDEWGVPIATGSCFGNTLRCMAVDYRYRGQGLLNRVVQHLMEYQIGRGNTHLFIYTKNREALFFRDLGFYEIANVDGMVSFLENRKNGFSRYIRGLKAESGPEDVSGVCGGRVGAVVMNANPFTLGHQYLVEEAASRCRLLHLFVVSEDRSLVPFSVRWELVRQGTKHLPNVIYHKTGPYIISRDTFPGYFLKEEEKICQAHARLDIAVFEKIAAELGITDRFVGEEKESRVTAVYNRVMLEQLNGRIRAEEISRKTIGGQAISASRVRQWIHDGNLEEARKFLPKTTWEFFCSGEGQAVVRAIQQEENVVHH